MIDTAQFPVTLIFPPQGHFTQPYLALPCISAYLKANGFPDVDLIDASIDSYDHFLSGEQLERARARVLERTPLGGFDAEGSLGFRDLDGYRAAAESAASAEALIERIEGAKEVVRSSAFYDPDLYIPAARSIYHGLRLFSSAWHPTRLTPHNFTMGYANDRSDEVLAAVCDEDQNPFLSYFREELLPKLVARKPRVVGMSVIYGSQLIPALTLGRMIKEALPDCHVTAGGGFLAYIGKKLMAAPGIDACLDSMIFHEGEKPTLELCQALCAGTSLESIGGLMWFNRTADGVSAVNNGLAHPIRLDEAPCPDFDGLPMEKYFSPEVVIPYDINRGCYYGECSFCTLPTVIGPGYRTRSAETIVDHTIELRDRLGTTNINYITDCMPPGMINDLPEELIRREAGMKWWCDARVEPKAYTQAGAERLYRSGCRKLLFGFESATPRILKLMKKGQSLGSVQEVANNCSDAGISVTFYAMVGFPTETREEARESLKFLRENSPPVREVSLQTFHIDEVAQTYHEPEKFGIEILDGEGTDLQLYHDYVAEEGMSQTEAAEMFDEMMQGFREFLPIFRGDTILYFMQKSHYFLHLASGKTPDEFAELCVERAADREEGAPRRDARAADGIRFVELSHSYTETCERLGSPLARAVRPDFLTGRFVEGALERAESELDGVSPAECVLAYDPESGEFCELTAGGRAFLEALQQAGSLGALLDAAERAGADTSGLEAFAKELHQSGLLHTGERHTITPTRRSAAESSPRPQEVTT
ncbi:MAG: radical SAM protein [Planctomycetes bacterium]|nr:radical SAM protein [Planctomycetota bacterium]